MADTTSELEQNPAAASARASAFTGFAALAIAMGIGRFAFTPILPMMQDDFGLSVSAAGWLASANYAGYLAGALSAIGLRVQPAIAIRVGLVAIGLSTLAMGLYDHFMFWIVLRAIAGVASAWVLIFVSAWSLERLAMVRRSELGGAVYAGVGAGIVIAGGACLLVMSSSLAARSADAWLILGVLSLPVTALIWPLMTPGPVLKASAAPAAAPIRKIQYWNLVICYGVFGFGYIIPATFLPLMAKKIIPDPLLFGWAWPAFGAAAIVSTVFAARWTKPRSNRSIWVGGHLVMALGVVTPLIVSGLPGVIIAALLVGGTFMVITMAGMQDAINLAGPQARALMAAMTSAFALGQILGPLAAGILAQSNGGFAAALIVGAALLLLSAISLMTFTARKESERE